MFVQIEAIWLSSSWLHRLFQSLNFMVGTSQNKQPSCNSNGKELDEIMEHWSTHYIRQSRCDTIAGKPDVLYHLPESVGALNYIKPVTEVQIEDMPQHCDDAQEDNDNDYQEYFKYVCDNELRATLLIYFNFTDYFQLLCSQYSPMSCQPQLPIQL